MCPDQLMKSVTVVHPSDKACVCRQGDDVVSLDAQVFSLCLGVDCKESIDETEELHGSFILSNVLSSFQQELVLLKVASINLYLSWQLFRSENFEDRVKSRNSDKFRVILVHSWDRDHCRVYRKKFRTYILQFIKRHSI
jgi:hypothetical protein